MLLPQRLIAAVPARGDADPVALIVDRHPQVPSRIAAPLEGGGADPRPVRVAIARRLHAAGAEAPAVPCNTAHAFAGAIRAAPPSHVVDRVRAAWTAAGAAPRAGAPGAPVLRPTGALDAAARADACRALGRTA